MERFKNVLDLKKKGLENKNYPAPVTSTEQ